VIGRELLDQFEAFTRPLVNRVANSIARAVISRIDDTTKMQVLQIGVLNGEVIDGAEHVQQYGFSSVPLDGAEAVVVFPNGDRGHPLVIATDDRRYRPTGEAGGSVLQYNNGGTILRLVGADVEIVPGSGGEVRIGSAGASDPAALKSDLVALKAAISGAATVANDGGAALKANILAALSSWPVSATKVKLE
jgi:phage gp45-like